MSLKPTKQEELDIAREAVAVFSSHGLSCCLIGGLACSLFGSSRVPSDVDLVVLTNSYDQESLKQLLVDRPGSKFYFMQPRTVGATWKVLWYRLNPAPLIRRNLRSCKVDILIPGTMNIPFVPDTYIQHIENLPVIPLIPLIVLKVQAWEAHRNDKEAYHRQKQWADAGDLGRLLPIAISRGDSLADVTWLSNSFVSDAKQSVQRYLSVYATESELWHQIGL